MYKTTEWGFAPPQSFITKGRQRLKQHTDTVFLNNGDEFEIELFNSTQNKVLAKIELNGKSIGSGVVLKPGQRVFLERYLDESRKFLFETYVVGGGVRRAIENNGRVKVSFYDETPMVNYFDINNISTGGPIWNQPSYTTTGGVYSSNVSNTSDQTTLSMSTKTKSKSIETGRVEKGGHSNQTFGYDSTSFYHTPSWISEWKILPVSQKMMTVEDIQVYCTNCGAKRKKSSYKFCPICGEKF